MSTNTVSYFSNAFPGNNDLFKGNIYRLDAKPQWNIGFRVSRADGNVYRYASFSAATAAGVLVAPTVADFIPDTDNTLVCGTAATAAATDGTAGSRYIQMTKSGVVAGQFAGGYLITTDGTGIGYTYRIKGNTASGNPASANFRIELYEPIQVSLSATTDIAIIGCLWNDVVINPVGAGNLPCGVTTSLTATGYLYSFVQTWGVCGVLADAAVPTTGDIVTVSNVTAGACQVLGGQSIGSISDVIQDNPIIGYCLDAGDSAGQSTVYLQIAP